MQPPGCYVQDQGNLKSTLLSQMSSFQCIGYPLQNFRVVLIQSPTLLETGTGIGKFANIVNPAAVDRACVGCNRLILKWKVMTALQSTGDAMFVECYPCPLSQLLQH